MSKPLLEARDVHKTYVLGKSPLHVLSGASLSIAKGEFVAIMGASGSGKSTLLHILGALDTLDRGSVTYGGLDVGAQSGRWREDYRNHSVGFVFQFYHLLPELSVFENILLPRMVGYSTLKWLVAGAGARREAREIMAKVGLDHRAKHRPNELSGGERQRAAIARALVNRPTVLLADEPTGNLDAATGRGILAVLRQLHQEGQTIAMVTHDSDVAARATRTVRLVDGRVEARR
ncbi:MAG: ABC transporter ATP-binding protein [bacterium]|nr:ABC transporter ATP-binding protein [bacterium]